MKHILVTILLLIAAAAITVIYFKSINQPGRTPAEVMQHIPNDAVFVAEFSNENGFYEVFKNSLLPGSVTGPYRMQEFEQLKTNLLSAPAFSAYFNNQHIFISEYAWPGAGQELLTTTAAGGKLKGPVAEQLIKYKGPNFKAEQSTSAGKELVKITIPKLRPFYIAESEGGILSGSFSLPLVLKAAGYDYKAHKNSFLQLSDQQNNNALAVLYINYGQLQPYLQQLFIGSNPELFRPLQLLPAKAALSLNYKTNALMFNGLTVIEAGKPSSYLNLFTLQQPVVNRLKSVWPSSTAYSVCFAASNTLKFTQALAAWIGKSGNGSKKQTLFNQIKAETGVNFDHDFNQALGNEFGIVTTRFQERLAIIGLAENQQLLPSLMNISNMQAGDIGQFKYAKIPFYLLGDAFGIFNKPYFTLLNNYLILANTPGELNAYRESYNNQKFLSKTSAFNEFDDLISERSNAAFFINFKNIKPVFKRDMKPAFYNSFDKNTPGLKNFYGASYQLIAAGGGFYTNFCMKLNMPDTTINR